MILIMCGLRPTKAPVSEASKYYENYRKSTPVTVTLLHLLLHEVESLRVLVELGGVSLGGGHMLGLLTGGRGGGQAAAGHRIRHQRARGRGRAPEDTGTRGSQVWGQNTGRLPPLGQLGW